MKTLCAYLFILFTLSLLPLTAQRQMESLGRGLVAIKNDAGVFLSWRLPAEEWYGVTYNVYRDGNKLNELPLEVSNYVDLEGEISSSYTVSPIVEGAEQEQCAPAQPWSDQYLEIDLVDRPEAYEINDATTADLDGDGEYEIIVKRLNRACAVDETLFTYFEAYKLDGTLMWEINVGPNILSSGGVEINIAAFDFDEDGKAEVFLRTSEGTIFGDGTEIGDVDNDGITNYRYSVVQSSNMQYMNAGPEFLSLVDGETGAELDRVDYIARGSSSDWGDDYGHRANKFFFGAPYLDGKKPSLFIGRGIYTKTEMQTYDVVDKKLVSRWHFSSLDNPGYAYQGNHNYTIADVDGDGRDEIVWGGMSVDDDGTGMYTTGLGHGDALHVGDLDPFRKGAEVWRCLENSPVWGTVLCDGTTGEILIHEVQDRDCGRCCAANISDDITGAALWGSYSVFSATSKDVVSSGTGSVNFRIYWDGDLLEELLDHSWTGSDGAGKIHKPNVGNLLLATGTNSCNWTKGTPSLQADLFGDWREEVIWRTDDDTKIRIYTTVDPTPYRNYTLMHDHQYRQAICWQMCGYNQPPHVSYFLGEREGMTVPPPPSTTNGRLVYQGGSDWTINSTSWKKDDLEVVYSDGEHVHFDILNGIDVTLTLSEVVSPSNMTVNSIGDYTIDATTGYLTGEMRLMKQGLGSLHLNGNHDYTGETEIWNGRLDLNGAFTASHVWVNLFGELSAAGHLDKGVTMRYGSRLFVGQDDAFGSLLINDSLSIEEGAQLVFDLKSSTSEQNDTLTIDGDLVLEDGVIFNIVPHLVNEESRLAPGSYFLVEVTGDINADINALKVSGILGTSAQLELIDNSIFLVVNTMREASTVVWSGKQSNTWDLANAINFSCHGVDDVFITNDTLEFNDESTVNNINISEAVSPSSVVIDASSDFSFSGTGAISGSASLTKKGTGTLSVSNLNTLSGKVSVEKGVLQLASLPSALEAAASPIGPVTSDAKLFVINGGTLQVTDQATMDRAMTIGVKGATLDNANKLSWNGAIVGDTLFKTGDGELVLDYGNTFENLMIKDGLVTLYTDGALPGKSVVFAGGDLKCCNSTGSYSSSDFPLYIPEGVSGTMYMDGRCYHNNVLTGKGELTVSSPFVRTDFTGDWSNFEGTINFEGSGCRISNSYGYAKAIVNIADNITAEHLTNATVKIGTLTGTGTMGNSIWEVGSRDEDFVFQGKFSSGTLKKVGSGTMILTAASTLTNSILVNEGALLANSFMTSTTGTANIYVKSGAFLGGAGRVDGSVIVQKGGTLYAGSPDVIKSSFKVGKVTMSLGSIFDVKVNTDTKATNKVVVSNSFYANGELIIDNLGESEFEEGQSFLIVSCDNISGAFSSIVPAVPGEGLVWDLSDFTSSGKINVTKASHLSTIASDILQVCPSITKGPLSISTPCISEALNLQLFSLSGEVIKEEVFSNARYIDWDIAGCASGFYIVSLIFGKEIVTKKILLK